MMFCDFVNPEVLLIDLVFTILFSRLRFSLNSACLLVCFFKLLTVALEGLVIFLLYFRVFAFSEAIGSV